MRASTSRLVYCIGLLVVTACAVLPEAIKAPQAASAEAAPLTTEARLAHAMRDRVALASFADAADPKLQEAVATETALRELAFADDVTATRRELISALTNELSDALADRSHLQSKYDGAHPELIKANAVVSGLTAAINTEVHRNRG